MSKTFRVARDRLTLLLSVPVLCLFAISSFLLMGQFDKYQNARASSVLIHMANSFNAVTHELQQERGATAGYLSSKSVGFQTYLSHQRVKTDAALSMLDTEMQVLEKTALQDLGVDHLPRYSEIQQTLDVLRLQVDNTEVGGDTAIYEYSEVISSLLGLVNQIAFHSLDRDILNTVLAYSSLLQIKENAGLERAIGAIGFEQGRFSPQRLREFLTYIARQEAFVQDFKLHATPQQIAFFEAVQEDLISDVVDHLRSVATDSVSIGHVQGVTGLYWFDTISYKVRLLKVAEDQLTSDLLNGVSSSLQGAQYSLAVFVVALLALMIISLIVLVGVEKRAYTLDRTRREADAANLAKSEFLSRMSHELRTPLNAIIGFSQFLRDHPNDPLNEFQKEYVCYIAEAGDHLHHLVDDILDLAKLEAGRVEFDLENLYPGETIEDCVAMSKPLAMKRDVSIVNEAFDLPNVMVMTDGLRLKQVVINLLSNAIKYNVLGGSVTIHSKVVNARLRICVSDTGIGIPEASYDAVFEPFDRLGIERKQTSEGTGIGLSVTKRLVEQMGGEIGFDSVEGQGTTFWFELALSEPHNEMAWSDDLKTGVEAIDDDHKTLIGMLNRLCARDLSNDAVHGVLKDLLAYTQYHFQREEAYMLARNVPSIEDHRAGHVRFAHQATEMLEAWATNQDARLVEEIFHFLKDWLIVHIMNEDMKALQAGDGGLSL